MVMAVMMMREEDDTGGGVDDRYGDDPEAHTDDV